MIGTAAANREGYAVKSIHCDTEPRPNHPECKLASQRTVLQYRWEDQEQLEVDTSGQLYTTTAVVGAHAALARPYAFRAELFGVRV